MREIKFRAKSLETGEFIIGCLVKLDYHNSVDYVEATQIILPNGHSYECEPETVGEFTGLHDRNGKEIYEGDVVKVPNGDFGEVKYNDNMFKIMNCRSNGKVWFSSYDYWSGGCEILGNIYENPDLLKGT